MELTNRNRLIIAFGLAGILVLGYVLYYFFLMPISVVKISPPQNSKDASRTPEITAVFDRKAASALKNVIITSEPHEDWSYNVLPDGNKITITPNKELKAKTSYVLEISGRRIKSFKLNFTTKSVEFGVGAPNAWESFEVYEKEHPLLKYLPFRTDRYVIMQSAKDTYFVIVYGIYKDQTDKIKVEVNEWFKEHGVDPNTVRIDLY